MVRWCTVMILQAHTQSGLLAKLTMTHLLDMAHALAATTALVARGPALRPQSMGCSLVMVRLAQRWREILYKSSAGRLLDRPPDADVISNFSAQTALVTRAPSVVLIANRPTAAVHAYCLPDQHRSQLAPRANPELTIPPHEVAPLACAGSDAPED
jgi:hypothetical protein